MTAGRQVRNHLNWICLAVAACAHLVLTAQVSLAAGTGEAAFTFLKIGTDARAEGMGGAHVALTEGVSSLYYNPAGMAWVETNQMQATYNNWLSDIQSGFLAGMKRVGENGRLGASAQYLDYGDIPRANAVGDDLGTFGASDLALAIGGARKLGMQSSVGATARFVVESIDGESVTAVAFDLGAIYRMTDRRTQLGASVRNLGFAMKSFGDGAKDKLPVVAVAGFSHALRGTPVTFALDVVKPYDENFGVAAGAEVKASDALFLRAGYNSPASKIETGSDNDTFAGIRLGVGFAVQKLMFDYGFGFFSELGSNHRITVRTGIL